MAITLKVNPYTDNNGDRNYRGKVYRSMIRFEQTSDFPTKIREPGAQRPGFLNLVEVTATDPDSLKNEPLLLRLTGHKVFILRRRFTNEQVLRIWFIVKKVGMGLDSVETEDKEILITGKLVLTIETEEETTDSTELDVAIVDTAP